ncbi:MAG: YggS family pyridoxal phosphate-dependent enzyme [Thermomicrobiales bacterium]
MSVASDQELASRILAVRENVARAARLAGRDPAEITIVAVSKTVDRAAVDEAFALGMRHFGENRVLDAVSKFSDPLAEGACLHLIGQLQTNKARPAVALFQLIESVDRPSLITALAKEGERVGTPVAVLLQVNVAREPQKAGCAPEDAPALMAQMIDSPWLDPRGLMTMAPVVADPEAARPVFAGLRDVRDELRRVFPTLSLDTLSMGMSNDYQVAIAEGATAVRIGRAIFGG